MCHPQRVVGIVERHRGRLIADRPLLEWILTEDLGPQLLSFGESGLSARRNLPVDDMQQRLP
jgi:hypothetical protein